jgi:hypothetical protein
MGDIAPVRNLLPSGLKAGLVTFLHIFMKNRKTHSPQKPQHVIATTLEAAASIAGRTVTEIKSAQAQGCLAFLSGGRIDCTILERWFQKMKRKKPNVDYYEERAKKMAVDRENAEQDLLEKRKLVWPIAKIKTAWARNVITTKSKLQGVEDSVSVAASMRFNLTTPQVAELRDIIHRNIRSALKELNVGDWGKTACPHCKKEIVAHE